MNVKNKSISTDARRRAAALLETLSVEEKLRQLGCTTLSGCEEPLEEKDLAGGIGAVALLDIRLKPKALACWLREIQEYIMAHSDHRIPALFHCEALGGPVVPDTCLFPNSIGLGATFAPQTVYSMADTIRRQMRAMGIRHALSPVLDVAKDLRWGRVNETYGGDPTLSAMMSCAYVDGLQGDDLRTGVAATAKHFLGYSQTTGGLNLTRTLADSRELREVFAKPFEAAIRKSGIRTVMNSYSEWEGRPLCASRRILTDLLRTELGFEGVVVSDYKELLRVKKMAHANWEAIDALAKDWAAQKFNAERQIDRLQERISVLKNEVEQILMERIRDKAHADIYDVMLQKRDEAIQSAEQQINEYRDAQASIEARKESMRPGIDLLDAITSEGSVSDAHLRMFVNKVYLHEQDGKLSVEFVLNADFQTHLDLYDQNGELTDVCNDLGYYFSKASANASA